LRNLYACCVVGLTWEGKQPASKSTAINRENLMFMPGEMYSGALTCRGERGGEGGGIAFVVLADAASTVTSLKFSPVRTMSACVNSPCFQIW
jgi:hypothetical protein